MRPLYFITGNKEKFEELKFIVPDIEQLDIDFPENQELDAKKIIKAKIDAAFTHHNGEFIVEDTGLYLDCLNGFPGPLIKWLLAAVGADGLFRIVDKMGNDHATAKTIIGYGKNPDDLYFFEGDVAGIIVSPRGASGFGWDPIFRPDGHMKTFAEMDREKKNEVSMRRIAADHLRDFLRSRS